MGVATQQNERIHAVTRDDKKHVKKYRGSGYVSGHAYGANRPLKIIQECEIRQINLNLIYPVILRLILGMHCIIQAPVVIQVADVDFMPGHTVT